eukprot:TCALIF_11571-PA protein Name:"Protein of unknown function" AED:0.64 eAED:1.00 QI:0/0/0/1/0/0.5/2/0/69
MRNRYKSGRQHGALIEVDRNMAEFIVGGDTNPPAKDPGRFYAQADPSDEVSGTMWKDSLDTSQKAKFVG